MILECLKGMVSSIHRDGIVIVDEDNVRTSGCNQYVLEGQLSILPPHFRKIIVFLQLPLMLFPLLRTL